MKIKTLLAAILWIIAILLSIFAIFKIVQNIEIAVGFITISFGILAIIWTFIARQNLSEGSSLRDYTTRFLFCLVFILMFSIWHTLGLIFLWKGPVIFMKYIFITAAYLIFAAASYEIWRIGKEFGFKEEAKQIRKIIQEKKNNKLKKGGNKQV